MSELSARERILGIGFLLFGIQSLAFGVFGMFVALAPQHATDAIAPFYQQLEKALGSTLITRTLFLGSIIVGLGWIADGISMGVRSRKTLFAVYLSLIDPNKTKVVKFGFCWTCVLLVLLALVFITGMVQDNSTALREHLGEVVVGLLTILFLIGVFGNIWRRRWLQRANFILVDTVHASSGTEAVTKALANAALNRTRDEATRAG